LNRSHPIARISPLPALAILTAFLCSACGDTYIGSRGLSVQHQYDHLACEVLANGARTNRTHITEIKGLMSKAERESPGSLIAAMVYGPQLAQIQADLRTQQETMEQKGCPQRP
jgi:hypothetical protein